MISIEQALEKVLGCIEVLGPEKKTLLESMGQVLADDIYSNIDVPPLDNSAMDGYAVQSENIKAASNSSPCTLKVIGEVSAGHISDQKVVSGTAMRIMTGASIPKGADAVVQFENTDEAERLAMGQRLTEIGVLSPVQRGQNIRYAGEDITRDSMVLMAGAIIRPSEIGMLASLGRSEVSVIRRPVVGILATGDELVDITTQVLPPGKIFNSNTFSLAAQVLRYGGIPKILGIAGDEPKELADKIMQAQDVDLLITSAGVSVGDYDLVKKILSEHGEINFWAVRMKPGKPLAFGVLQLGEKKVPHLGIPGNPVSSMVVFEQFARPAIMKLMGKTKFEKFTISAISESRIENREGRRILARVKVIEHEGRYYARLTGSQGSGILSSMVKANGLMVIPEENTLISEGETVRVQMLDWFKEGDT